jgi:formamidopyrimidine-DNA glycosylase
LPELPEVETVRLGLERQTRSMTIARVQVLRAGLIASPPEPALFRFALEGSHLGGWLRRGKYLMAQLLHADGSDAGLWGVHLRMTGQFLWIDHRQNEATSAPQEPTSPTEGQATSAEPSRVTGAGPSAQSSQSLVTGRSPDATASPGSNPHAVAAVRPTHEPAELPVESHPVGPHTRARIWSERGDELRFIDTRSFGQMWWVPPGMPAEAVITGLARLGPEPFDPQFSGPYLQQRLRHSSRSIKTALLDQSLVAGVGNIYADECLFAAGIQPNTPCRRLRSGQLEQLRTSLVEVLRTSIGAGGTTFRDFRDLTGTNGNYGGEAWVYRRTGLPCRRCGTPIQRQRLGGRSTHWCPTCQP